MDVQGVCKSTVVRGEGGFPGGTLRVSDCHDTVVYALAPLQVGGFRIGQNLDVRARNIACRLVQYQKHNAMAETLSGMGTDRAGVLMKAWCRMQFASVFACSDCTVVIGAVGRMVRLERCERVQLICAAARIIVSSCHDCILHLAVNRAPLLIGDNRFLQVRHAVPYCFSGSHADCLVPLPAAIPCGLHGPVNAH